jgi:PIN domain nuclease of toxin-antitoxin system
MRALLDTHVFLWWITDAPQLPPSIRELIADGGNELFLSAASCWEIAIKAGLGKITLPGHPDRFISDQMVSNAVQALPIEASHALHVFHLPPYHRDPFDRIIIAQAQLESMPIITSDPLFPKYKIKTIWEKKS